MQNSNTLIWLCCHGAFLESILVLVFTFSSLSWGDCSRPERRALMRGAILDKKKGAQVHELWFPCSRASI